VRTFTEYLHIGAPEEPCRLPAGLQSDPYLKQVVSRTVEAGARWPLSLALTANVSVYRAINKDDIHFRSVNASGQQGYFANFPRTRHQGVDAEVEGRFPALVLNVAYSYLEATYEAEGLLRQGERNITVSPGTPISGLPRHTLKISADWRANPGLSLGADVQAASKRGTLGNEDGLVEDGADQRLYVGLPGYAVINLRASWRPWGATPEGSGWEVVAKVHNVLDRRYETFGALAETVFDASGQYAALGRDAVFVAPGASRGVFLGVRCRYR
jgi:outer membrane receptor protein involved in Fe transport